MKKKKLIITLKDKELLERVYSVPKSWRGKFIESALKSFLQTREGLALYNFLEKRKPGPGLEAEEEAAIDPDPVKRIMGDF